MTWHDYHVKQAIREHGRTKPRRMLVVGCNTGFECRLFLDEGAEQVAGIDVVDDIGSEYPDPRIEYVLARAEELPFDDDDFDLVYAFATMEHVHGIEDGFAEMGRVTKPGGLVYSISAPLWYSPFGHHKNDLFPEPPWLHLRYTRDEILDLARERGIVPEDGSPIEHHVDYMLNPDFFNRRHARDYVAACDALAFDVRTHDLLLEEPQILAGVELDEPPEELLAVTHRFIARKPGGRRRWKLGRRARG